MSRIPIYAAVLLGLCLFAASAVRTFGDGGELWGMGDNSEGQLGLAVDSSTVPVLIDTEVTAVAASLHHTLYITDDGCLWGMGRNTYGQLGTGDTAGRTEPRLVGRRDRRHGVIARHDEHLTTCHGGGSGAGQAICREVVGGVLGHVRRPFRRSGQ